MVVQGHLIWEEAELVTSKVSKDKNTVKKKKWLNDTWQTAANR